MSWVKQRKLPAVEAIRYQGLPCNSLPELWNALHSSYNALHSSYNAAANRSVQLSILDDVLCLTPWCYLKSILANDICASGILSLANSCITLRHWPQHFKESVSVIIPKPGKPAYDTPKAFQPIVLLNTLGKLIEKMIARRLQFDAQCPPSQPTRWHRSEVYRRCWSLSHSLGSLWLGQGPQD